MARQKVLIDKALKSLNKNESFLEKATRPLNTKRTVPFTEPKGNGYTPLSYHNKLDSMVTQAGRTIAGGLRRQPSSKTIGLMDNAVRGKFQNPIARPNQNAMNTSSYRKMDDMIRGVKTNIQDPTLKGLSSKHAQPYREANKQINSKLDGQRKADEYYAKKRAIQENYQKTTNRINNQIDKLDQKKLNGGVKGIGQVGRTYLASGKNYFFDPKEGSSRLKKAGIGVLQSSAVSAAGHAGVAYVNGSDPWEAAKQGAVRGAMVGAGYQGLKGATRSDAGSIWGNVKQINATTKDLYKATTVKGREQIRKEGASRSLSSLLSMESGVANNRAFYSKPGNTSTAQAMGLR